MTSTDTRDRSSGTVATVRSERGYTIVMIAAGYYSSPNKPLSADDVTYLWERVGKCEQLLEISFPQLVRRGRSLHAISCVNQEWLLELLLEYCALDEVVAIERDV